MDELAYAVDVDPLELRLNNYSDRDQIEDRPYSSKQLRECYRQGAEKFGWSNRNPQPRSMRDGNELVGWGMATGIWEAMQMPASARAVLTANGSVEIASATADIGPGTYTMMAQLAAELLGVPLDNVTVKLGDSALPDAPVEGGSFTTSSVGSAIHAACRAVLGELLGHVQKIKGSPLAGAKLADVVLVDGRIRHKSDGSREVSVADAMRAGKVDRIEQEASVAPKEGGKYSHLTHSAVFAEVTIDEQIGVIRVTRVVSAVAAGRILRREEAYRQPDSRRSGRRHRHGAARGDRDRPPVPGASCPPITAEAIAAVNADVHAIDVIFRR